jgi:hypothetical protein
VVRLDARADAGADERAAYLAEQEARASQPPCARCGWTPFVVIVQPVEAWAPTGLPADDGREQAR